MTEPAEVAIRDDSIRLGQFLKLADLVDQGSDAKLLLADGLVLVNDTVETRRGRQLVVGDVVAVGGRRVVVVSQVHRGNRHFGGEISPPK